jgi:hypothetical protein
MNLIAFLFWAKDSPTPVRIRQIEIFVQRADDEADRLMRVRVLRPGDSPAMAGHFRARTSTSSLYMGPAARLPLAAATRTPAERLGCIFLCPAVPSLTQ